MFMFTIPRGRRSRRLLHAALWSMTVAGASILASGNAASIDADEQVILFPAFAAEGEASTWKARISGVIYEPGHDGLVRRGLLRELKRLIRQRFRIGEAAFEQEASAPASHFSERARMFVVDNERSEQLSVTLAGKTFVLGPSAANGHFEGEIQLPAATGRSGEWIDLRAVTEPGDTRVFAGRLQFIGRSGVSVVSDIDDTIKDSNVTDKPQLALNTFVRDFRAASGMAALYQRWAASGPVAFHYVSGSPFQLYPDLAAFVQKEAFPAGSVHLRKFRLKDRSLLDFFGDPRQFKLRTIRPLLDRFRGRQFVLVGDSGEKDPEVYAQLARECPNVVAILIRRVTNEDLTTPRLASLFEPLPARVERRLFSDPKELADFTPRAQAAASMTGCRTAGAGAAP